MLRKKLSPNCPLPPPPLARLSRTNLAQLQGGHSGQPDKNYMLAKCLAQGTRAEVGGSR